MRNIDSIVLHCSATEVGTVESIRKYHIQHNGWQDIGYHFVIYKDGSVHKGRKLTLAGAHCPEANKSSIGVCLIGDKAFTDKQFKALATLLQELCQVYPTIKKITGHREYPSAKRQGKTCPNFEVKDFLSNNKLANYK